MDSNTALLVLCAFFGGFGLGYWCFVLTVNSERNELSDLTKVDPQMLIDKQLRFDPQRRPIEQKPGAGWW